MLRSAPPLRRGALLIRGPQQHNESMGPGSAEQRKVRCTASGTRTQRSWLKGLSWRTAAAMNYRHAFHAGGFADVIKHIVLARILTSLQDKQASFRVIDTHAGAGLYDLTSDEARRGGEWLTGIARLMQARFSEKTAPLLKPYLDIVRAFNPQRDLEAYPGSPLIARALLRPQDRLTACEVEPQARKRLIDALRRDTQARVVDLDGWVALPAFVPPKERRGLVLIDPPYEQKDEFERLAGGFAAAFAK